MVKSGPKKWGNSGTYSMARAYYLKTLGDRRLYAGKNSREHGVLSKASRAQPTSSYPSCKFYDQLYLGFLLVKGQVL